MTSPTSANVAEACVDLLDAVCILDAPSDHEECNHGGQWRSPKTVQRCGDVGF
jgi:hypothetical protein